MSTVTIVDLIAQEFGAPDNGILLWYGTAADVPNGWAIVNEVKGVFILGSSFIAARSVYANTHTHTNTVNGVKSRFLSAGNHKHTISAEGISSGDSEGVWDYTRTAAAYSGHSHGAAPVLSSETGLHDHTAEQLATADHTPPYIKLYWIKKVVGVVASVPYGGIIMYKNTNIPAGWAFCDGANNTPDLRGRFVLGAVSDAEVKTFGGNPSHKHGSTVMTGEGGTHNHTATLKTDGAPGGNITSNAFNENVAAAASGHIHMDTMSLVPEVNHKHAISVETLVTHLPPHTKLSHLMRI